MVEISGLYSGDRTSKGNESYSKLTLLFQRNIIERWKQKRTSTLRVSCNPHSFYSHVASSIACEQALCLGKEWKTHEERKSKGGEPVDKHLGPSFHGTRCETDPDASCYWLEHWLLTPFHFPLPAIFSPFPQTESLFTIQERFRLVFLCLRIAVTFTYVQWNILLEKGQ